MGIPVIPARKALLTRPYDGRPPCHYCRHCMDGCDVGSIFSTPASLLPKAVETGNLTLRTNAVAREILVDAAGRARAVSVIDRVTRQEEEIGARIFRARLRHRRDRPAPAEFAFAPASERTRQRQ